MSSSRSGVNSAPLKFSVVVCTYSMDRFNDLLEALDSISHQQYSNIETVIVVDGNRQVYDCLIQHKAKGTIHLNETNLGLSKSRNIGANLATGTIVAFMDDDAVADPEWVSELANMYLNHNAIVAGGKLSPLWVDCTADFIPEEFFWLIGATPKGTSIHIKEVRNTYGSNISFSRGVFLDLGGFNGSFGFNAGKGGVLQGEEAELCNKIKIKYGKGCMYNPDAVVFHKVFKSRVEFRTLFRRAFWQGYSKRALAETSTDSLGDESNFLKYVFFNGVPGYVIRIPGFHPVMNLKRLFFLVAFTGAVGFGYVYRIVRG